jgi:hypothetical protein
MASSILSELRHSDSQLRELTLHEHLNLAGVEWGVVSEFLRFSPFLEVLNVVSFDFTAETIDLLCRILDIHDRQRSFAS